MNRASTRRLLAALALACCALARAQPVPMPVVEQVQRGLLSDPLTAVEASRTLIIDRLVARYRDVLARAGVDETAFRAALEPLRADQLLGAALVDDIEDVTTIVAQGPSIAFVPKDGFGTGSGSYLGLLGTGNLASGDGSAVIAGKFNQASGTNALVGAGQSNIAAGISSLVIGGFDNHAQAIDTLVGAGAGNRAIGLRAAVVGGGYNLASGRWSFVGGGGRQSVSAGIAGTSAEHNVASGDFSVVAGGQGNVADSVGAEVAGGMRNSAGGPWATVAGGHSNTARNTYASVAGGYSNAASNYGATISGGNYNEASGQFSAIPGGIQNIASGNSTFAAGHDAHASEDSTFVWNGWSIGIPVEATTPNMMFLSGDHGVRIDYVTPGAGNRFVYVSDVIAGRTIHTWTGAYLSDGGVWTNASDRNLKDGFADIDAKDVLRRVASLPVQRWHYKVDDPSISHIGPVAQDFHAAFGLGDGDTAIGTVDADGVALASIQALKQLLDEKDARIDALEERLRDVERRLAR